MSSYLNISSYISWFQNLFLIGNLLNRIAGDSGRRNKDLISPARLEAINVVVIWNITFKNYNRCSLYLVFSTIKFYYSKLVRELAYIGTLLTIVNAHGKICSRVLPWALAFWIMARPNRVVNRFEFLQTTF
jgi:hypothetical protein